MVTKGCGSLLFFRRSEAWVVSRALWPDSTLPLPLTQELTNKLAGPIAQAILLNALLLHPLSLFALPLKFVPLGGREFCHQLLVAGHHFGITRNIPLVEFPV